GHIVDFAQDDGLAKRLRQLRNEPADCFGVPLLQHLRFRRGLRLLPQWAGGTPVFVNFVDILVDAAQAAGSARKFATADVAQDREEPRLDRRAAEGVEMAQRTQIALLHGVFGIARVVEQVAGERVNVVEMRERGVAKAPCLVFLRLTAVARRRVGCPGYCLLWRSIEHHDPAPAPLAASTVTVPVICGCKEQKYA